MKKTLLVVAVLILGITSLNAQGFYLNVEGGYGWGLPSNTLGTEYFKDQISPNGSNFYKKNIYGTIGAGLNLKLTPGYMITKNIGIELGVNYFKGKEMVITKSISTDEAFLDQRAIQSNQLRLVPTVVFNTGGKKLYGYAKVGLALPIMGKVHVVNTHKDPNNLIPQAQVDLLEVKASVEGAPSLGFYGALGIGYHFTDLIGIHLEVFHTSLSIKPKAMRWESYKIDGVDHLKEQDAYYTQINYVDEINNDSNNGDYVNGNYYPGMGKFDKDKPKEELAHKTGFDQLGIMIGVSFSF